MHYKVTRTIDNQITAVSYNRVDGQYGFVPVDSEKATRFNFEDATSYKKDLEKISRYADGSIRQQFPGTIQIVDYD